MRPRLHSAIARAIPFVALTTALASVTTAQVSRTYTTNADFAEGVLDHVNFTTIADQLQLDTLPPAGNFPFLCVALSASSSGAGGTLVRVDATTGQVLGEYRTAPQGRATDPSRVAVDALGNVWVGNQAESGLVAGVPKGSVVKIGIVVGGTRVDANGTPNPNGLYLQPPFQYSTAVDRDGDGLIRTSRGLGDVHAWPDVTDGVGGSDGLVQDALDETILVYQRTSCTDVRHVSLTPSNDVVVGGYNFTASTQPFDLLRSSDGALLNTLHPTCGGLGGIVDASNRLWSTDQVGSTVLRFDLGSQSSTCVPLLFPHGLTSDTNGFIWVTELVNDLVAKIDASGNLVSGFPKPAGVGGLNRTVAVSPVDNDVWIASQTGNAVSRLDNNGVLRTLVRLAPFGNGPVGISVDSNGKIWVACQNSGNAVRIDPNGGGGLGAVDLAVPLGAGSSPFDYGKMTGDVPLSVSQPDGSWSVIYDSGAPGTEFGRISYDATTPAQTSLDAEYRAADTVPGLALLAWQPVQNGVAFSGVFGRFVEVRVNFQRASPQVTASPVLRDLTIESLGAPTPCECGKPNPGSLLVFPEFDNRSGSTTLLTVTNTAPDGDPIKVEFVYIGRYDKQNNLVPCLEFNRTHTLTPNDTLSVITGTHNPNQNQGYVYVFAKHATSGQAIVHNFLTGQALLIDGRQGGSSSHTPETFIGIGAEGTLTDHDGDGLRDLNNIEYGCSPAEILVPRFLGQGQSVHSDLVLLNLSGGSAFTATIDFLVYNDNEEAYSAQTSFQCWVKRPLLDISSVFSNSFLLNSTGQNPNESVGIESGWFRMNGLVANSSAATIVDPAFLALLVEHTPGGGLDADLPFVNGGQTNGDLLCHSIFGDTTP